MGMQTFTMYDSHAKSLDQWVSLQCAMQASSGIFAKHQVLAIGQREGLFVHAFDCCLQCSAQGFLCAVDQ